jgi:hypothetical protein
LLRGQRLKGGGGVGGGLFIAPPQKEPSGGFPLDKSGEDTRQAQWTSLESDR